MAALAFGHGARAVRRVLWVLLRKPAGAYGFGFPGWLEKGLEILT